jgi:hypothetical protein
LKGRVLSKICGSKREEVTEYWREMRNDELHYFYSIPYTIRVMQLWDEMSRTCGTHEGVAYNQGLMERPLGRPRHRGENNIKMVKLVKGRVRTQSIKVCGSSSSS